MPSSPIISKSARARLAPRREPYFVRLRAGGYVGYRAADAGDGSWIARYRGDDGKQHYRAIGSIADDGKPSAFDRACQQASAWFDELDKGVEAKPVTVLDACNRYAQRQGAEGSDRRKRADQDIARLIAGDPIAKMQLFKLRPIHVEEWRGRMAALPARVGRSRQLFKDTPRTLATMNRDLVMLRAALRLAHEDGFVSSDVAWRKALKPFGAENGTREVDLTKEQRRILLEAADDEFRPLVRALMLLPLRPGAVVALRVGDFDARRMTVTIREDKRRKNGSLPPTRTIPLPPAAAQLFREQSRDKLPSAILFANHVGGEWSRNEWAIRMRAAVARTSLPRATTLYTLRHTTLTDLVVANELSLLTIAQIAGTSVRMIEKTYGHLRQENAAAGLAVLTI